MEDSPGTAAEREYLRLYAEYTDARVRQDPHEAVGGLWEEIGRLQYDFLVAQGLAPEDSLLDIGCGTLRGGRHLIRYLAPGRYVGIDISPEAVAFARRLVADEGLADKAPELIVNDIADPVFRHVAGRRFDILVAQSVFTHLPGQVIADIFTGLKDVTAANSRFYFTYYPAEAPMRRSGKTFAYPLAFFEQVARNVGWDVADMAAAYPHPRGQVMAMARPASG